MYSIVEKFHKESKKKNWLNGRWLIISSQRFGSINFVYQFQFSITPSFMAWITPTAIWITTRSATFGNVSILSWFTTCAHLITFPNMYGFNFEWQKSILAKRNIVSSKFSYYIPVVNEANTTKRQATIIILEFILMIWELLAFYSLNSVTWNEINWYDYELKIHSYIYWNVRINY